MVSFRFFLCFINWRSVSRLTNLAIRGFGPLPLPGKRLQVLTSLAVIVTSFFSHTNHLGEDFFIRLLLYTEDAHVLPSLVLFNAVGLYDWRPVIHSRNFHLLQLLNSAKAAKEWSCEEVFGNERRHPNVCSDDAAIPSIPGLVHSRRWLLPSSLFAGIGADSELLRVILQ